MHGFYPRIDITIPTNRHHLHDFGGLGPIFDYQLAVLGAEKLRTQLGDLAHG